MMATIRVKIEGMHCQGCATTVETRLARIDGVRSVKADHEAGLVEVRFVAGQENEAALREAFASSPYELASLERRA